MKPITMTVMALAMITASVSAQIYTVRPNPFGGGWNTYSPNGGQIYQTRPNPFGGGWNVYDGRGNQIQQVRPNPFGGGYNIYPQTMPRRYGW